MMKFGTDGLRGRANVAITPEVAMAVGNALVGVLGPRIAVARDTRPSGPMLVAATVAGICAAGGEPVMLGVVPTPALSALVAELGLSGGVMVTASHNPPEDNGLKAVDAEGHKLEGAVLAQVEGRLGQPLVHAPNPGSVLEVPDADARYVRAVLAALPGGTWLSGTTIVVDTANGACGGLAARVIEALGARVIALGDGYGPINVGCGAMHPEALVAAVKEHRADAGIALDGDGDRGMLVTASGRVLDGDALTWLCAQGSVVIGTIMSNGGLEAGLTTRGIRFVRTPVGDAHVAAAVQAEGALVGGEPSGHLLFSDGLPTSDGLLSALRALHPDPRGIERRLAELPWYAQAHAAVKVPAARIAAIEADMADLRAQGARLVVRPSGTEAVVRVMVEHHDAAFAERAVARLRRGLEG